MLGKESRLETGEEGRCGGRRQLWDQAGRVGSQHGQAGKSDVAECGDGKGLDQGVRVSGNQKKKGHPGELLLRGRERVLVKTGNV